MLSTIAPGGRVPWDHISAGLDPVFLAKERDAAMRAVATEPCGRFKSSSNEDRFLCYHCGVGCRRVDLPVRAPRASGRVEDISPPKQGRIMPRASLSINGDKASRVLLYLSKWGRQIYLGHLDTMRQVMRTFRRAGLELSYTQGFNPKPKVVSGPPLPLGMAALKDPLEVRLIDPPNVEEILARLGRACPPDMSFVSAEILPAEQRSLGRRIRSASYLAFVSIDRETAIRGVNSLLAMQSIEVVRDSKGRTAKLDIRPYIADAAVVEAALESLPFATPGDRTAVKLSLLIPGSGGARPAEALDFAFGKPAEGAWIVRTGIDLED